MGNKKLKSWRFYFCLLFTVARASKIERLAVFDSLISRILRQSKPHYRKIKLIAELNSYT